MVYHPQATKFEPKLGPIFNNLILADEINRAPAKVQSALLEAMQERQVTLGDHSYPLPEPFLVLATQNPIDQEGTYQLPEAQLDRFLLKVTVGYPTKDEELLILDRMATSTPPYQTKTVATPEQVGNLARTRQRHLHRSRRSANTSSRSSTPRDSPVSWTRRSRTSSAPAPRRAAPSTWPSPPARCAFMHGRAFVTPQDVKDMALDVLRHRILLTYEAEAEEMTTDSIIERIMNKVPVP